MDAAPDSYLRAPCAPQQMMTQGLDRPAAPVQPAAAPAPHARRHTVCHGTLPTAQAALRLQPAVSAVSSGSSSVRCRHRVEGITQPGSRAAATDAIHRAAPCAVAPPGQFTCGTDELCSGRRPASRHGCCARFLSPSAVCTPANDDTRTQPPRCPGLASIRPCTLRAAINCMPRDISGGGSSFGTAASCTCRVVG